MVYRAGHADRDSMSSPLPRGPRGTSLQRSRRAGGERGQSLVEVAIVLPMLLTVLLGILELATVFSNKIEVDGAARDAARAAAVARLTGNGAAAATAAARSSAGGLDLSQLGVAVQSTWVQGSLVTVTVTYPYSVKIYGMAVRSGTLSAVTRMRVE
jgi:Flp pilus assembly protein TadG